MHDRYATAHTPFRSFPSLLLLAILFCYASDAFAFRVFDVKFDGLGITRWDAAPHFVDDVERSLDGGLRYSVEGGSYATFRDRFEWMEPAPTASEFQSAIEEAFAVWEAVDPMSGLDTDLYFVADFDTPVVIEHYPSTLTEFFGLNRGAEIDIASQENLGSSGGAHFYGDPNSNSVTLTSGVTNYAGGVITGADIRLNTRDNQANAPWELERFQAVLSHEIGHAIGLGDVDVPNGGPLSFFYDDNFDNTSDESALTTLTNSFALLIDPFDPDHSPGLMLYEPCSGASGCTSSPGLDSPGVDIHMESSSTGRALRLGPQADDFAGRQFLYPYVGPRPGDFDHNDVVDGLDFLVWQRGESPRPYSALDLADWEQNFGMTVGGALGQSAAVPEPTSLGLFILGLSALALSQRRSRWTLRQWPSTLVKTATAWSVADFSATCCLPSGRSWLPAPLQIVLLGFDQPLPHRLKEAIQMTRLKQTVQGVVAGAIDLTWRSALAAEPSACESQEQLRPKVRNRLVAYVPAAVLLAVACSGAAHAQPQTFKLLADDGADYDNFGWSVALSGNTAVVGAQSANDNGVNSGAAYLFDAATGQQFAKLLPDDGTAGDLFGISVAISGNTAIVGARGADDSIGDISGGAYLFDATTGQQLAKLNPDDGASNDFFGTSVAIDGNTALVSAYGAYDDGIPSGAAYLFDASTSQQVAKLLPEDGVAGDIFGQSVAISGSTAIVGAAGSAYLFNTKTGQQLAKLLPSGGAAPKAEGFGGSVAINGNTAIVGARGGDDNGDHSGAAYLFDATTGQQLARLIAEDGLAEDFFGQSVSLSGSMALVGAPTFSGYSGRAAAYMFDVTTSEQLAKLVPDNNDFDQTGFGMSVALSGSTALIGAHLAGDNGMESGSAHLFVAPEPGAAALLLAACLLLSVLSVLTPLRTGRSWLRAARPARPRAPFFHCTADRTKRDAP